MRTNGRVNQILFIASVVWCEPALQSVSLAMASGSVRDIISVTEIWASEPRTLRSDAQEGRDRLLYGSIGKFPYDLSFYS